MSRLTFPRIWSGTIRLDLVEVSMTDRGYRDTLPMGSNCIVDSACCFLLHDENNVNQSLLYVLLKTLIVITYFNCSLH